MPRATALDAAQKRQQGGDDDICPVCKAARYLNPNMRFLINPECYHKMCESCVDRIFSQGPAPCPVAGCARTLRKQRFRVPKFEDLQIEREVDVRRRVAAIFNRRESEFQTLLDYNNYLEEVESLTSNLIHNIDVPTTEAKLAAYAAQNSADIAQNSRLSQQESASQEAQLAAQKEAARARREDARREEDDERKEREEGRKELLDRMASSTTAEDADQIAREAQKVVLKKSTARRTAVEKARQQLQQQQQEAVKVDNRAAAFTIAGLKPVAPPEPEKVYDPFAGYVLKSEYYTPRDQYENPYFDKLKADARILPGGYDVREYSSRAMLEAFAGLGVFLEEELDGSGRKSVDGTVLGTAAAAIAGGDLEG